MIASVIAFATLAGCASPASRARAPKEPPPPPLETFVCRRTVAAFVAPAGLTTDQLDDVKIRVEPIAGGDQVAHYVVTARPQTCSSGLLVLIILPDCSIDDWETTPPCRLPALEPTR